MKNQETPQSALATLPFSQMLGEPVRACVQAQVEAARVTKRYLNSVTLRTNEAGKQEAVMIAFRYQNGSQMLELSMPLMALVPLPHFSVDRLDIEFNALVDSFDDKHLTCSFASRGTQTDSEEQQTITTNHHLKVRLQASQNHMPIGLSKLFNLLDETIALEEPQRPSLKADLLLNTEQIEIFVQGHYPLYPIEPVVPEALVWSSSNPTVATVNARGGVTAHRKGEAYIFVESSEARGRCHVIVRSDHSKLMRLLSAIKLNSQRREAEALASSAYTSAPQSYISSWGISSSMDNGAATLEGGYGLALIERTDIDLETTWLAPEQYGLTAFHTTHTAPARARGQEPYIHDVDLLTTIMSALQWRKYNGPIRLYTDSYGKRIYEEQNMNFIWDGGINVDVLDGIQDRVDFSIFWAGAKLYALRDMQTPCVMLDTDMIVWKNLNRAINPRSDQVVCVHKEYLSEIYPSIENLKTAKGYRFSDNWKWSAEPFNTALLYISDPKFKDTYTSHAIEFMVDNLERANDEVSQMVFAEQRLLGICAENTGTPVKTLLELDQLHQQDLITHVWGAKQALRQSSELAGQFCCDIVDRLFRDFEDLRASLLEIPVVRKYFDRTVK
ncbi:MAG: DUF2589 domain-containing protein [Porphyromonadaceae bacterium]|nr:DUF2589 domain-containing protein [Porphyromonadaceae bacterium]